MNLEECLIKILYLKEKINSNSYKNMKFNAMMKILMMKVGTIQIIWKQKKNVIKEL